MVVQPRRAARADLEVLPLSAVAGRISGPEGAALENVVIRLSPGSRYTATAKDGSFTFYNLREGDYTVALDTQSLPQGTGLASHESLSVRIRAGVPAPPLEFRLAIENQSKPVRKVLDRN